MTPEEMLSRYSQADHSKAEDVKAALKTLEALVRGGRVGRTQASIMVDGPIEWVWSTGQGLMVSKTLYYQTTFRGKRVVTPTYSLHALPAHQTAFAISNEERNTTWAGAGVPASVAHVVTTGLGTINGEILVNLQKAYKSRELDRLPEDLASEVKAAVNHEAYSDAPLSLIEAVGKSLSEDGRIFVLPSGSAYEHIAPLKFVSESNDGLACAPTYRKALALLRKKGAVRPTTEEENQAIAAALKTVDFFETGKARQWLVYVPHQPEARVPKRRMAK